VPLLASGDFSVTLRYVDVVYCVRLAIIRRYLPVTASLRTSSSGKACHVNIAGFMFLAEIENSFIMM